MKDQSFVWFVWRPDGGAPKKKHYMECTACEEAHRLAQLEKKEVYVLKLVGSYAPSTPPVEWIPATYDEPE